MDNNLEAFALATRHLTLAVLICSEHRSAFEAQVPDATQELAVVGRLLGRFLAPTVGMGCTEYLFTDRRAYTVVAVSASGKTCKVQADIATRTDSNGMSEAQEYSYAPDTNAAVVTLRLTKKGWRSGGRRFGMGHRRAYHDFSF